MLLDVLSSIKMARARSEQSCCCMTRQPVSEHACDILACHSPMQKTVCYRGHACQQWTCGLVRYHMLVLQVVGSEQDGAVQEAVRC